MITLNAWEIIVIDPSSLWWGKNIETLYVIFFQGDDLLGGDREYSLYDDNMSGSESEESGGEEDQSNRLATQPTYQYQYQQQQQPAAGNGRCWFYCCVKG